MVGWMKELLLGGQEVGRVVETVQRVEEVDLQGAGGEEERGQKVLTQNSTVS